MDSDFDKSLKQDMKSRGYSKYCSMKEIDDFEYESWVEWRDGLQFASHMLGYKLALEEDKPIEPTETSSPEERDKYEQWVRSNDAILAIIKSKMSEGLYYLVEVSKAKNCGNARQILAALEEMILRMERVRAPSLLKKLVNMRYNGKGNVKDYLLQMDGLVQRLRAVDVALPEYLINQIALDSLPSEFDRVRFRYDVAEEAGKNWDFNTIKDMCDIEETSLKNEEGGNVQCFSFGHKGHMAKDCRKISRK